jgi:hypothetical protein
MRTNRTAWSTDMLHGYAFKRAPGLVDTFPCRPGRDRLANVRFLREEIVTKRLRADVQRGSLWTKTGLVVSQ